MTTLSLETVLLKKPMAGPRAALAAVWNAHLSQNRPRVKSLTILHDEQQMLAGVTMTLKAENVEQVRS